MIDRRRWLGTPLAALGAAPFADTYITAANGGEQAIVATQTSYAFPNVTIGDADSRRQIVLLFSTQGGTACEHSSVSANAGGVTFALVARTHAGGTASTNYSSIWIANVPAGSTLTAPTLVTSAAPLRASIFGWMHGRGSTATDTITEQGNLVSSGVIDHSANGFTIAHGTHTGVGGVPSTFSWIGVTAQYNGIGSGALKMSGGFHAGASAETNRTISFTTDEATPGNQRLVAAAWGAKV